MGDWHWTVIAHGLCWPQDAWNGQKKWLPVFAEFHKLCCWDVSFEQWQKAAFQLCFTSWRLRRCSVAGVRPHVCNTSKESFLSFFSSFRNLESINLSQSSQWISEVQLLIGLQRRNLARRMWLRWFPPHPLLLPDFILGAVAENGWLNRHFLQ